VQADHFCVLVGHFRFDHHEVQIRAGVGVAAAVGAEQDYMAGLRRRDDALHHLLQDLLVNHPSNLTTFRLWY